MDEGTAYPSRKDGRRGESRLFRESEHEVHCLNGLTSGPFDQIIECSDRDDPAGSGIGEQGQITIVRTPDVAWIGHEILEDTDKSFLFIEILVQRQERRRIEDRIGEATVSRAENPPIHWNEMRRKRDGDLRRSRRIPTALLSGVQEAQLLFDLWNVAVPSNLIGFQ